MTLGWGRIYAERGLLAKFSALHPGAAKQLAVLFLRHTLAPLLDY
jgi:hypothetical protein